MHELIGTVSNISNHYLKAEDQAVFGRAADVGKPVAPIRRAQRDWHTTDSTLSLNILSGWLLENWHQRNGK